ESDGIVYQRMRPSQPARVQRQQEYDASGGDGLAPHNAAWSTREHDQMLEEHVRDTIIRKLSESLKVDVVKIDVDTPFADYGIDSITGVHLVQVLNGLLKTDLETISLFDYSTVNALTGYILAQYGDAVRATFSPSMALAHTQDLPASPQRGEARS